MISGLIASSSSLGAFAGPSIAGYFNSKWGFEWSTTVCAFIVLSAVSTASVIKLTDYFVIVCWYTMWVKLFAQIFQNDQ